MLDEKKSDELIKNDALPERRELPVAVAGLWSCQTFTKNSDEEEAKPEKVVRWSLALLPKPAHSPKQAPTAFGSTLDDKRTFLVGSWKGDGVVCVREHGMKLRRQGTPLRAYQGKVLWHDDQLMFTGEWRDEQGSCGNFAAVLEADSDTTHISGLWEGEAKPAPELAAFLLPTNPIRWAMTFLLPSGLAAGGGFFDDAGDVKNKEVLLYTVSGKVSKPDEKSAEVKEAISREEEVLGVVAMSKIYEEVPTGETAGYEIEYKGHLLRAGNGSLRVEGTWRNAKGGSYGSFSMVHTSVLKLMEQKGLIAKIPEEKDRVGSRWHGILGVKELERIYKDKSFAPKIVAKSALVARPGYSSLTATEFQECSEDVLMTKVKILANLLSKSKKAVVYTGAGISTNSGIPDYATKAKDTNTKVGKSKIRPMAARPTLSHCILAHMHKAGYFKRWFQQNHDGLPQKAGFPQLELNEIHGSWFNPGNPVIMMDGNLREDLIFDVFQWARDADFVIVLGTSLSGMNADQIATKAMSRFERNIGQGACIVNIQNTKHDAGASVRIYNDIDEVLVLLAGELGLKDFNKPLLMDSPSKFETRPNVFLVPYDEKGRLTKSGRMMELNLSRESVVVINLGRDKGAQGTVTGRMEEHYTMSFKGVGRGKDKQKHHRLVLGSWWLPLFVQGKVPEISIMNVRPTFVTKDNKRELGTESVKIGSFFKSVVKDS